MTLTTEQVEARKHGLGASMAAPACGLSRYKTPYRLWREMLGIDALSEAELLHQEIGRALEPVALNRFEKKNKVKVIDRQLKIVDPQNPWRWVTLDGRCDTDGIPVEAKSVGMADPEQWGHEFEDDQVPMEYYIQVQHGLACNTEAPYAWLPVIVLNRQFRIYRIWRSPGTIQLLTDEERKFLNLVESKTPPALKDQEDVSLAYPSHIEGHSVECSDELAIEVAKFKDSKDRAKKIKDQQDEWKFMISNHMGEAAELTYRGRVIVTYKKARDGMKFDTDSFAMDHPALYNKYLKPSKGSRRMLTK